MTSGVVSQATDGIERLDGGAGGDEAVHAANKAHRARADHAVL